LSSTSDYAPNTNQLLTNYSFITRSLALSLALKIFTGVLQNFQLMGKKELACSV
jgi:hypothetical protein